MQVQIGFGQPFGDIVAPTGKMDIVPQTFLSYLFIEPGQIGPLTHDGDPEIPETPAEELPGDRNKKALVLAFFDMARIEDGQPVTVACPPVRMRKIQSIIDHGGLRVFGEGEIALS